jgi:hypothetical protein
VSILGGGNKYIFQLSIFTPLLQNFTLHTLFLAKSSIRAPEELP